MLTDWLTVALVGVVALFVAAGAARRAGDHADRRAGRRIPPQAHRRGAVGAVADLLDGSIAMYAIRRRLGRSTATRAERHAAAARAATLARAEEIRRARSGSASPGGTPAHLVITGTAATPTPSAARDRQAHIATPRTAGANELLVGVLGLAAVMVLVVAVWPRDAGGVLSATGTPSLEPTGSPSPSPAAATADPSAPRSAAPDPTPTGAASTVAASPTPTPSPTAAPTASPTAARSPAPTAVPVATPRRTVRPTLTPAPSAVTTPTPSPSPASPSPMPSPSLDASPDPLPTPPQPPASTA